MNPELQKVIDKIDAVNARMDEAATAAEAATAEGNSIEEFKALIENELKPQLNVLTAERDKVLHQEEFKALQGDFKTLQGVIDDLRKPSAQFSLGVEPEGKGLGSDDPYADGAQSVFADIYFANKGSSAARDRLTHGVEGVNEEGKALTEGVQAQGGYLVRPQVERQIVQTKEIDNVLRGLCSKINVSTNEIQLDQLTLSTQAGWVAELAQKPELTGLSLATVTASVFTAAGLATISNQLLADSNPAVDALATADLTKRLVALEERAFIQGSGTGQPLGILNTPGIGATPLADDEIEALLDAVLDAVADIETEHGAPTAILLHPRTWTRIIKAKEASDGAYLISPDSGVQDPRTGQRGPTKSLWGYPVITSSSVPTDLGAGTNESRVIIGDFKEALILDRQGITVDESRHVHFTTNATVFRAEERVGFTAARTPAAFNVIGGAGLANG